MIRHANGREACSCTRCLSRQLQDPRGFWSSARPAIGVVHAGGSQRDFRSLSLAMPAQVAISSSSTAWPSAVDRKRAREEQAVLYRSRWKEVAPLAMQAPAGALAYWLYGAPSSEGDQTAKEGSKAAATEAMLEGDARLRQRHALVRRFLGSKNRENAYVEFQLRKKRGGARTRACR